MARSVLVAPRRSPRPVRRRQTVVNASRNPGAAFDDAQLLRRIAGRDRSALSQLYDRYAGVLYSTACRILNSPEEAGDVLEEVFVKLWDTASRYDPAQGGPFHWALTITLRQAIDRLRASRRRYLFIGEITVEGEDAGRAWPSGTAEVFTREQAAAIHAAVAALPLEQRQAIELAFLGGMNQNEIAASLRQPLGTIQARVRRGILKLRHSLRHLP